MINRNQVDYLPPELEVPNGGLENVESGEKPKPTQENFAKLCRSVTQIQLKRLDALDSIENKLQDIENRLVNVESGLRELDVEEINSIDPQAFRRVKSDVEDVARILSALKTEAMELEEVKP